MTIKRPAAGWNIQRITTYPSAVLREDFIVPMGISANQLALRTRMPPTPIGEILHERRSISPDTALRLARYFGTSAEFWLNMQAAHDLSKARLELKNILEDEIQPMKLEAARA